MDTPTLTTAMLRPSSKLVSAFARSMNTAKSNWRTRSRIFSTHSKRGTDAVTLLPTYLADARAVQRYCPQTAPEGALQLGVAENQMLEDLLVPSLTRFGQANPFPADCIYYQPTHGRPSLRQAFCKYLERTLGLKEKALDPEGLVLGAGCNAVLENLCMTLTEPGDGVLIPTPYYAAFEFDLVARASLRILPVNTFEHSGATIEQETSPIPIEAYFPTKAALNKSLRAARHDGVTPRVLLLSHPNNPLGISYPPSVMKECIDWCREHQIHLISDEIYAGSVYNKEEANFTSALELAGPSLGDYVHLVYALSKDFALSGLRVGACYSENMHIRLPMQKLNDLGQISSQTQVLVEEMMTSKHDDGAFWTDSFLEENHRRIRDRNAKWQDTLDQCGIPYLKGNSGLFVWMDFSQFLPPIDPAEDQQEAMEKRERSLYLELMNDFGLLFTPGLSMRNERPGFFRCVFTAASDEEYELSLKRLVNFVNAKRQNA